MRTLFIILLIAILSLSFVFAHDATEAGNHTIENGHTAQELSNLEAAKELAVNYRTNRSASIWPWEYFAQGRWVSGFLSILIWIAVLYTFGQLILLVIGRHL